MMISALFVEPDSIYSELGLDCWDEDRDARNFGGPNRVIAHPPCDRWGRYWHGGPSSAERRFKGHDGGCFAVALWAVRTFGGLLEHPEASHAWDWHGLVRPHRFGGWTLPDAYGGRSCCVEQGHYGHRARKATWLYANLALYPDLKWGPSSGENLDAGFHSAEERTNTPRPFAALLLELVTPTVLLDSKDGAA